MSFPRAKLQRFNEIQSSTPSPADYNPKVKGHVSGAIISTTGRFVEPKSPAVSDNTSMHSTNSTTCFRTPTLPKKKKHLQGSLTKVKSSNIFCETEDTASEALNDKIVECNNKDIYIKELTEQIEDMKTQLSKLKSQKQELEDEKQKFEDFVKNLQDEQAVEIKNMAAKHFREETLLKDQIVDMKTKLELMTKEYEELKALDFEHKYEELINHIQEDHQLELANLHLDYTTEQNLVKKQFFKIYNEMVLAREEWNKLHLENRRDIEELLQNIAKFQNLNSLLMKTYNEEIKVKEEIINKETQVRLDLMNELNQLRETHKKETEDMKCRHKLEMEDVEYEMLKTITEMQNKLDLEKKSLESTYKSQIANMENSHKEAIIQMEHQIETQRKQVEEKYRNTKLLTEEEVEQKCNCIENEWKLKLETQMQHSERLLLECKELHEFSLTQCKIEKEHLEKDMEEKLREVNDTWKSKLEEQTREADEILKECQAISEYSIIQCELEKNDVKTTLAKTLSELEDVKALQELYLSEKNKIEDLYTQLKLTYEEVICKLENTHSELIKQKELHKNEVTLLLNEKHTFDVTITKTRKTVEALTKRLFDSDRDVEQLKAELESCENSKLAAEDKCNKLTAELESLTKLYEDLELQNESSVKLSTSKIEEVEKTLLGEVEKYKKLVQERVADTNKKIEQKDCELKEIKEQLHHQQTLNFEAQNLLSKVSLELEQLEACNTGLEHKVSALSTDLENSRRKVIEVEETYKELREQEQINHSNKLKEAVQEAQLKNEEVQALMKQINHLQEKSDSYYQYCEYYKCKVSEYEKEIDDLNVIQKNYIDQSGKYDELLQKYETQLARNAELTKTVAEQESLIGPFREQLEAYEMERTALICQKHDAENEAKIMGMKYAQILGHQNQKQKIKHLVDLKRKNYELLENKSEMEQKIRAQAKTIEKLKKEVASFTKTPKKKQSIIDKENINSPNRSLNNSHVSSPLRERN